jgi:uncharacterized membrane protein YdfJ with MMPL/SSD domain
MLTRLADLADRRPRRILVTVALLAALAAVIGGSVATVMKTGRDNFDNPRSESVVAAGALERAGGGVAPEPDVVAVVRPGPPVRSAAGRRALERVAGAMRADPGVARVAADPSAVSRDGRASYVVGFFRPGSAEADEVIAERLDAKLGAQPGVDVGGPVLVNAQVSEQVSKDLARAEAIALPLLLLVSLFVFRGLVAALLPVAVGMLSILGTLLVMRVTAEVTPLSIFALNLVTGLGLGLAIDYSLLVVSRYREEVAEHGAGRVALQRTMATAGRTVVFSSLTVALAMACLVAFPERFLRSMGIGGASVALLAALVSVTALPALLAVLGPRIDALAPRRLRRSAPATEGGAWYRLSRRVMRRPVVIAGACAVVLLAAGLPSLRVEFGGVDATVLPQSAGARQAADALTDNFASNVTTPTIVTVRASRSDAPAVRAYAASLDALPGVDAVRPPQAVGDGLWRVDVMTHEPALADSSQEVVERLRDRSSPFPVQVSGDAARFADQQSSLSANLPLALALLVLTTAVALFLATGSVVLPVKALLMNGLTISAAFGILVLIFQDGRLEGPLGFSSTGSLESGDMVLLFVLAFALATDYGVFLLSRIKEARDAGAGEAEAVALGLERTGRTVTAAAALFCIAIGAFATSEIVFIKAVGIGTAAAVLIDATIVRALLLPSLMRLLGHRNWWAPAPLRRWHDRTVLRRPETRPPLAGAPAAEPSGSR